MGDLVKHALHEDPLDGALYVFINRRRTQIKCLWVAGDSYSVWRKRLEQGQFRARFDGDDKVDMQLSTLKLLIDGMDLNSIRRFKRHDHRPQSTRHVQ